MNAVEDEGTCNVRDAASLDVEVEVHDNHRSKSALNFVSSFFRLLHWFSWSVSRQ